MNDIKYRKFSIENTNLCKGIAICLMITHHLFWNIPDIGYKIGGVALSQRIGIIGKVCVSIYLILSGIGIYESTKDSTNLSRISNNKILKLYFNYIFIVFTSLIIGIIFFKEELISMLPGKTGIFKVILTFTGLQYIIGYQGFNEAWWFISVIILCYFMYPKILKYIKVYKYKFLFICFLLTFLECIDINRIKLFNIISWSFPFIIGVYISEANILIRFKKYINKKYIGKIAIVLLLILALYVRQEMEPQGILSIRLDYILALIIIIDTYIFLNLNNKISKFIIYLGQHSMNIFYVHMFVSNYYLSDVIYGLKHPITMFLFTLFISLLWSIALNQLKKIIKFNYYINKIINNFYLNKRVKSKKSIV